MLAEIESFMSEGEDCVLVDFEGMSVEDAQDMRNLLRESDISMRVLKTSLARLAAKSAGVEGAEAVLSGPTAMCFGGDSVATVARTVRDFSKGRDAPKFRGGFLEKEVIGIAEVEQLANLPSREELLAQVIGTIIAPATQSLGAMTSLLTAVPGLTKALEEKQEKDGGEG